MLVVNASGIGGGGGGGQEQKGKRKGRKRISFDVSGSHGNNIPQKAKEMNHGDKLLYFHLSQ